MKRISERSNWLGEPCGAYAETDTMVTPIQQPTGCPIGDKSGIKIRAAPLGCSEGLLNLVPHCSWNVSTSLWGSPCARVDCRDNGVGLFVFTGFTGLSRGGALLPFFLFSSGDT